MLADRVERVESAVLVRDGLHGREAGAVKESSRVGNILVEVLVVVGHRSVDFVAVVRLVVE